MGGYDFVLFDLGGVLVRLRGAQVLRELSGIGTDSEVWDKWMTCRWVRTFERGRCTPEEFATGLVADWRLPVTPAQFLDGFLTFPEGLYDGALELVSAARRHARVGCLSNSNAPHWQFMRAEYGFDGIFDVTFLSHEIGYVKPDAELFEHVARALGVPARRVAVVYDNLGNVRAAQAIGFAARQVQGTEEARAALRELGVLPGGWPLS